MNDKGISLLDFVIDGLLVDGILVFHLKLDAGISVGNICLSDPEVQSLIYQDFKLPTIMSVLHLSPLGIRDGMPSTSHGNRPASNISVSQAVNKVHRLSVLSHSVGLSASGILELIPQFLQLSVIVVQVKRISFL